MRNSEKFKLIGKYKTPEFKYGALVDDAARGKVRIVGLSAAKIPWPLGKQGPGKSPVVYRGLARAVRRESVLAVMHRFGVSRWRVQGWRRALGVPDHTPGTLQLLSAWGATRSWTLSGLGHRQSWEPKSIAKRYLPQFLTFTMPQPLVGTVKSYLPFSVA